MSRTHSSVGIVLCLTGLFGLAHKPMAGAQVPEASAPAAIEAVLPAAAVQAGPETSAQQHVTRAAAAVSVSTRAFDLKRMALSDFGDLDLQN